MKLKHRFQHLPVAYTGLALGIGGFGNCLLTIFSLNGYDSKWITCITIALVSLFLLMIFLKNVMHPKVLKHELSDPLTVSLLPTFSMCLMIIAGFIGMWDKSSKFSPNQIAAAVVMCIALLIQLIMIGFFIKIVIKKHVKDKNKMFGTYFVPTVGIITSCTVSNNIISLPNELFQAVWFLGYAFFVFSLPIVTYWMLFKNESGYDAQFPSVAVWFAPANLSCAGFIQTFLLASNSPYKNPSTNPYPLPLLYVLLFLTIIIGFVVSLLLYFYVYRIFRFRFKKKMKDFTPILCSMSFPCAIGATSMVLAAKFFAFEFFGSWQLSGGTELQTSIVWFFAIAGFIFAILTFVVLLYLLINMIVLGIKFLFTKHNDDKKHQVYSNIHHVN